MTAKDLKPGDIFKFSPKSKVMNILLGTKTNGLMIYKSISSATYHRLSNPIPSKNYEVFLVTDIFRNIKLPWLRN